PYKRDDSRGGDRPYRNDRPQRDDRRRDDRGGDRRSHTPQRGGAEREYNPYAPVRERVPEPPLPDDVTPRDLHPAARNELKTLSMENAERVARLLAMSARLIDEDPELAHEYALAASRRAGRIPVVRESVAITAYAIGDFALALRELRTYRRISGREDQIALIVDSERGVGRPDRALEEGRGVDRSALPTEVRVALAIAMSGARMDRGELELALGELEIPELDPDRAFEWSPALFAARAAVLEDLGRIDEAEFWAERAETAADALVAASAEHDEVIVEDGLIEDFDDEYDEDAAGELDDAVADVDDVADEIDEADVDDAADEVDDAESEIDDAAGEPDAADDSADDLADAPEPKADDVAAEAAEILVEAGIDEADPADEGKA
ncbi:MULTISPECIES: hypothetical protein, partial [unclassified Microbacterium]|uniref:hypothetical protein n=1 Tax=unclassified Microbacterium TaxID=2609290 RepID=UPI001E2D2FE7